MVLAPRTECDCSLSQQRANKGSKAIERLKKKLSEQESLLLLMSPSMAFRVHNRNGKVSPHCGLALLARAPPRLRQTLLVLGSRPSGVSHGAMPGSTRPAMWQLWSLAPMWPLQ